MNTIGERIRAARKARKMTQKELAEELAAKLGRPVSEDAISTYESGRRGVSAEILAALADVLNVTTDYLSGRTDDPHGTATAKDNLQPVVAAIFRAQTALSPKEKERMIRVLRAGWPEIFGKENEEKGEKKEE